MCSVCPPPPPKNLLDLSSKLKIGALVSLCSYKFGQDLELKSLKKNVFSVMYILPANSWLYQLAMSCYFISYVSWDILVLRCVLASANVFLFMWGYMDLGGVSVDTCAWNGVFFFINLSHAIYLIWQKRPVQFLSSDYENIHNKLFDGALSAMTSKEFQLLSSLSLVRELRKGSSYADHGSKPHNLSILVSGSVDVVNYHNNRVNGVEQEVVVNVIKPLEFLDSPQWISRNRAPNQRFLVTLRAAEDCRYIMWPMEALEKLFEKQPQFKTYLECVVGCDVAEKLMQLDRQQKDDFQQAIHVIDVQDVDIENAV